MNQSEKDTQPAPKSPAKVTERVVTEVDRWGDVRVVGGHKTYKLGHKTYKLKQDPKEHAFAHLGEYPYTYIGYQYLTYQACPGAPIQVGGSCDHCMTGIKDAFRFRSADGKVFKVGNQCVAKAGDRGLKKAIDNEDGMTRHEQRDFLASLGFEEFRSTGWANDKPEWWTDLHEEVSSAMTLEQHLGIPATGFLANSTSVEEYKAKLDGFKRERMAR
jgi:hypothetical protein